MRNNKIVVAIVGIVGIVAIIGVTVIKRKKGSTK